MARLGHCADVATEVVIQDRIDYFALRVRHILSGKHIRRVLVFAYLENVRLYAKLIERATKEHSLRRKTVDEEIAHWRNVDSVACGRNVILTIETQLHVCIDGFA